MDLNIPMTLVNWLLAFLPMVLLFTLLVFMKWPAPRAGFTSLAVAAVLAFVFFQAPLQTIGVAMAKGAWDSIGILLVVWTALLLYQVTYFADAFAAIRIGVQKISHNYLFLILMFGWIFASFLQGVAGFGAPIAIAAPILLGLGMKPLYAVVIPLIGINWATIFGTLGTAWTATLNLVTPDNLPLTLLYTSLLLIIPCLIGGLFICYLYGKWEGIKEGIWMVLLFSLIQGGGELLVSQFNAVLSTVIPSVVSLVVAIAWVAKWPSNQKASRLQETTPVLDHESIQSSQEEQEEPKLNMYEALAPYFVLSVLSLVGLGIPAVSQFLGQFNISFAFPTVTTGYDYLTTGTDAYAPLALLRHASLYLLISAIFAYYFFRSKGCYQGVEAVPQRSVKGMVKDAKGPSLSILAFLMMSQVLSHSGQNAVLALGIGMVAPPILYVFLAPWIGSIGTFMTSSTTSSNILFIPMQTSVAQTTSALSFDQMIAFQSGGSAVGNSIAPTNIILGLSTVHSDHKPTDVYRISGIYMVLTGLVVSIVSVLIHLYLPH
ncbi:L-lactate permease [Hutsoniella sourekii]|uniref:L-lactate permease n=1 Tax=Hutsoniella sourekii TaxID=87650 RepID=UPI000482CE4F|nr:L-lactate permease [Hutsoniella sourekii]